MPLLNLLILAVASSVAFSSNDTFREIVYLSNGQTYHIGYFDMPIDHFSQTNEEHFHLRFLISTEFYETNGPVFLYPGGQGSILDVANDLDFPWAMAEEFGAAVVFVEHRYYGASLPYGQDSFQNVGRLQHLSLRQTLADFIVVATHITVKIVQDDYVPIVAFGDGYSGMLATWLRLKFPEIITGVWTSAAPLLYFNGGGIPLGAHDAAVSQHFARNGCSETELSRAFAALDAHLKEADGLHFINKMFRLDGDKRLQTPKDVQNFKSNIRAIMAEMSESRTLFESCQAKSNTSESPIAVLGLLAHIVSTYESKTLGESNAVDSIERKNSRIARAYQQCTDLVIRKCSQGPPNDVFWPECTDKTFKAFQQEKCQRELAVLGYSPLMLNENAVHDDFGFHYCGLGNVISVLPSRSPWTAGALALSDFTSGMFAISVVNATSGDDMRSERTEESSQLVAVRKQIVQLLKCMLGQMRNADCVRKTLSTDKGRTGLMLSRNCHRNGRALRSGSFRSLTATKLLVVLLAVFITVVAQ